MWTEAQRGLHTKVPSTKRRLCPNSPFPPREAAGTAAAEKRVLGASPAGRDLSPAQPGAVCKKSSWRK